MKQTKKIALSAIYTALCTIILYLGSIFQILDISVAAIGSLIVLIAMIDLGTTYGIGTYIISSILSLLLLPNKSPSLFFAFFLGFYPLLKTKLNNVRPLWFSYLIRILCANVFLTFLIFITNDILFQNDFISQSVPTAYLYIALYVLSNVAFCIYDMALERFANTYILRIKPRIFNKR